MKSHGPRQPIHAFSFLFFLTPSQQFTIKSFTHIRNLKGLCSRHPRTHHVVSTTASICPICFIMSLSCHLSASIHDSVYFKVSCGYPSISPLNTSACESFTGVPYYLYVFLFKVEFTCGRLLRLWPVERGKWLLCLSQAEGFLASV